MTPMPLAVAVEKLFPHGGVTIWTLRAACRNRELAFERIGRGYLVTEADVMEWRNRCRDEARERGSISGSARDGLHSMSSSTESTKLAQAAALMMSRELTRPCQNTSQRISGQTRASAASTLSTARRS
jgi:hypothetical protein